MALLRCYFPGHDRYFFFNVYEALMETILQISRGDVYGVGCYKWCTKLKFICREGLMSKTVVHCISGYIF